ncbi:MAG: hypothetical protein KF795_19800 [Labilithrix sp.]|nr:hypothetical protein [Labilithrix sp.]
MRNLLPMCLTFVLSLGGCAADANAPSVEECSPGAAPPGAAPPGTAPPTSAGSSAAGSSEPTDGGARAFAPQEGRWRYCLYFNPSTDGDVYTLSVDGEDVVLSLDKDRGKPESERKVFRGLLDRETRRWLGTYAPAGTSYKYSLDVTFNPAGTRFTGAEFGGGYHALGGVEDGDFSCTKDR